jgi:hypothetical protein
VELAEKKVLGRHVIFTYNNCMIQIEEYMQLSKQERQTHLRLNEPCVLRGGGSWVSVYSKGLLAYILDTTIPTGRGAGKVQLCHACHNGECSNPFHLYWGTPSDNVRDAITNGKKTIWECSIAKYGLEEAKRRQGLGNKTAGGKANKGKIIPPEQRKQISDSVKLLHEQGVYDNVNLSGKRKIYPAGVRELE